MLLVNARITELKLPSSFPLFRGKYADFTVDWYRFIGSTISFTMFINIFTPHIGGLVGVLISGLKQCLDQGCCCNSKRTKKVLQEDYEELYTGPEFLIEVRYS